MEICHPFLSTMECFDLILEAGRMYPGRIHCIYGGNYDASMMIHDMSLRHMKRLKDFGECVWKGYRVQYVPRKWLEISKAGVRVRIFDVVSFFASRYVDALVAHEIGTHAELELLIREKDRRAEFLYAEIDEIAEYMRLELRLGVALMEKLRETFLAAGFDVRSWHGPGSLARIALNRHNVKDAMARCPSEVNIAAQYAFAGGRFEMFRAGHFKGTIYNADIRSAYPHFARFLPNLNRGKWRYNSGTYEAGKFAIYHIRYRADGANRSHPNPLFRRLQNGEVCWPTRVEGWYHQPEAELVAHDPRAEFIEGWVFDEDDETDRPFAWIEEYFHRRQLLKKLGDPAEFTFKLIINSVYGQLAQRTGWDKEKKTAPRFHQLEWAGYITSACRALIYRLGCEAGESLISIDTDGLYATKPLSVTPGKNLGEWELDEFDEGIFWQSGIYYLREDLGYDPALGYGWKKAKTRGIPKGTYSADQMLECLARSEPLSMERNTFTGFGLALNNQFDRLNTWEMQTMTYEFGGRGKRFHNETRCHRYCPGDDVHILSPNEIIGSAREGMSCIHPLPWLADLPEYRTNADTIILFDLNDLDDEESWILKNVA